MEQKDIVQIQIPEQRIFDGQPFPLVYAPAEHTKEYTAEQWYQWFSDNSEIINKEVFKYGAVLFRGFPTYSAESFDKFVKTFKWKAFPYIGGAAPRTLVYGDVFTTNESPPEQLIPFHHEMAQVAKFPQKIFFFCEVEPSEGGETPIVLSNLIYEQMKLQKPEFVQKLLDIGVKYTRVMPDGDDPSSAIGRGWQSTYGTDNKEEAQNKILESGGWLPDGSLKMTSKMLPPIRIAPTTGQTVWFNQMVAAYTGWIDVRNDPKKAVTFANGDPLDDDAMKLCVQIKEDLKVSFKWKKGDIIAIDNWTVMHSRNTFVRPRRILAALCE